MKTKFVNFKKDEFSQKIIELSKNNKAPSFKNTIFVIFYNISWILLSMFLNLYLLNRYGFYWYNIIPIILGGFGIAHLGFTAHMSNHIYHNNKATKFHGFMYDIFLGVSSYIWRIRHNGYHHIYTNLQLNNKILDCDTTPAYGTKRNKVEKTNKNSIISYGSFLLASLTLLPGFYFFDLFMFFNKGVKDTEIERPKNEQLILFWLGKLLFLLVFIVAPYYVYGFIGVMSFILMLTVASVILFPSFEIAHTSETPEYILINNKNCNISWQELQIRTSANFSMKNKIATWFFNGLNYQIEHHLYPHISYSSYPELSPFVLIESEKKKIKYISFDSWLNGVKSVLKQYNKETTEKNTYL